MSEEKNKIGRPLITTNDLPIGWEEKLIAMGKEGCSIVEMAVEMEITRPTLYALMDRDEHFFNTIKKSVEHAEAWYTRLGRHYMIEDEKGQKLNYTGWYMQMKNRFGWADRQENKNENNSKVVISVSKEDKDILDSL